MRRWNGWGEEDVVYPLPKEALGFLVAELGESAPAPSVPAEGVPVPLPRLPDHPGVVYDPKARLVHARGQSFADLAALRFGKVHNVPDGVAFPVCSSDIEELLEWARGADAQVIPYGGGTSVTGGVNPVENGKPVLTLSLERMQALLELDQKSHLASFEAGVQGPWLEAQLRANGFTLGHFPQSFAYSSLGGWVVTHSSGQESLGYGRIADMFQGGRMITPAGRLDLPPHPASAAGAELKYVVLGSEGCFGVLTEAVVRVRPLPEEQTFVGALLPGFEAGLEAVRELIQARVPLCMLRLSDAFETRVSFLLANLGRFGGLANRALRFRMPKGEQRCLLLYGAAGRRSDVAKALQEAAAVVRTHKGIGLGRVPGKSWQKSRFRLPYLRNALWEVGYGVDTLETATAYSKLLPTYRAVMKAMQGALATDNGRVYAMAHLSHGYETGASLYFTFFFRLANGFEETLACWRTIKHASIQAILGQKATLTHHHGVGSDHLSYMTEEKGEAGLSLLRSLKATLDPTGMLNPGKLLAR
jgi:alkyldihydroxyacetonephosphate synthase